MMKKTLLLSALALGLISSTAGAFTAQDFANKATSNQAWWSWYGHNWFGGENVPYMNKGSIGDKISYNSTYNTVVIEDFIDLDKQPGAEGCYMFLTVNNNKVTINQNVNRVYIQAGTSTDTRGRVYPAVVYFDKAIMIGAPGVSKDGFYYFLVPKYTSFDDNENAVTGTASTLEDGNYQIELSAFSIMRCKPKTTGTAYAYGAYMSMTYFPSVEETTPGIGYGGMSVNTYSENAKATDILYDYNNNKQKSNARNREYYVKVHLDGFNFSVENWGNYGKAWSFTQRGNSYSFTKKMNEFTGSFDVENSKVYINTTEVGGRIQALTTTSADIYRKYIGSNANPSSNSRSNIEGELTYETIEHDGNSRWINVSDTKTYLRNANFAFEDYTFDEVLTSNSRTYNFLSYIANTNIKLDIPLEYTHDLGIKATTFGYGQVDDRNGKPYDDKNYIYINASLENIKNDAFVESHELYIMPTVANPDYNSVAFAHEDKGHINGTRIDLPEYFTYYPNYPADKKAGMSKIPGMDGYEIPENPFEGNVYNVLIPEDALTLSDPNQRYSLYVKTIYTPESGLEPTFHALTALTNNPTGVESIIDNGENDDDAPVYFYNMNGVQVDGNNLTPGLYIRRQGATSTKVLIK